MLNNITYDYQGEYECQASNIINGQERIVVSEPVILEVVGAPQVLHFSSAIEAHRGDNVALSLVVCADPRPRHVSWEWGSLRLEAGDSYGKRFIFTLVQTWLGVCSIVSSINKWYFKCFSGLVGSFFRPHTHRTLSCRRDCAG